MEESGSGPGLFREFEGQVRSRLPEATVQQEGHNSQWSVVYRGETVFASIRVDMGDSDGLRRLRDAEAAVRSALLRDGAERLRQLRHGEVDLDDLYEDFEEAMDEREQRGWSDGKGKSKGGGPTCEKCGRPLAMDKLGGRHMCRVIVTYKCEGCKKKWTSQRGRFDPLEDRVMDQYCEACKTAAAIVKWDLLSEDKLVQLQSQREQREQAALRRQAATAWQEEGSAADGQGWEEDEMWGDDPQCGDNDAWHARWKGGGYACDSEWQGSGGHHGHSGWWGASRGGGHAEWQDSGDYGHPGTYVVGYASKGGGWYAEEGAANFEGKASGKGVAKGKGKSAGKGKVKGKGKDKGKGKGKGKGSGKYPEHAQAGPGGWAVVSGTIAMEDSGGQQSIVPRLVTKEHPRELCEPCRKWGDCSGWFADPFFILAAATFLVQQQPGGVDWQRTEEGFRLRGVGADLGQVKLILETRVL